MPIFREESHAKNRDKITLAIELVEKLGNKYVSPNSDLTLHALQKKRDNYSIAIHNAAVSTISFNKIIDNRHKLHDELNTLVSKINKSLGIEPLKSDDMNRFNTLKKIFNSQRRTESKVKKMNQHSVSHKSYESRVANFETIVTFLEGSNYSPNYPELQIANLKSFVEVLKISNTEWHLADKKYHEDIITCNENKGIVKEVLSKLIMGLKLQDLEDKIIDQFKELKINR